MSLLTGGAAMLHGQSWDGVLYSTQCLDKEGVE
jgi:hypothetical protein